MNVDSPGIGGGAVDDANEWAAARAAGALGGGAPERELPPTP